MKEHNEKIPDPKEMEKEISEFLSKKFGENVKIVSPMVMPQEAMLDKTKEPGKSKPKLNFDLKPEELIAYLDQYIVKQDNAKAILATKICTHFNRIKRAMRIRRFDRLHGRPHQKQCADDRPDRCRKNIYH